MILADIWTDSTLNEEIVAFIGENDAEGGAYVSIVGGNNNRRVLTDAEAVPVMARRLKEHSGFLADMEERAADIKEIVMRHRFQEGSA